MRFAATPAAKRLAVQDEFVTNDEIGDRNEEPLTLTQYMVLGMEAARTRRPTD
jgi:hypothetical protein